MHMYVYTHTLYLLCLFLPFLKMTLEVGERKTWLIVFFVGDFTGQFYGSFCEFLISHEKTIPIKDELVQWNEIVKRFWTLTSIAIKA